MTGKYWTQSVHGISFERQKLQGVKLIRGKHIDINLYATIGCIMGKIGIKLGSVDNEFGYYEQPTTTTNFIHQKRMHLIGTNVQKFCYEQIFMN